jgi:hypothetical protein
MLATPELLPSCVSTVTDEAQMGAITVLMLIPSLWAIGSGVSESPIFCYAAISWNDALSVRKDAFGGRTSAAKPADVLTFATREVYYLFRRPFHFERGIQSTHLSGRKSKTVYLRQ